MSLYERIASEVDGPRRLAKAELRQQALAALRNAFDRSGLSQSELAKTLGIRKSAVSQVLNGNGNVTVNTLSDYAHACGCEISIQLTSSLKDRAPDINPRWKSLNAGVPRFTFQPPQPQQVVSPTLSHATLGAAA